MKTKKQKKEKQKKKTKLEQIKEKELRRFHIDLEAEIYTKLQAIAKAQFWTLKFTAENSLTDMIKVLYKKLGKE